MIRRVFIASYVVIAKMSNFSNKYMFNKYGS